MTTETKQNRFLFDFLLHLADTNLVLAQNLSSWCGHGPILEQDIALTNIALDLLGQSQYYYDLATLVDVQSRDADRLAMLRRESEYRNLLLVEMPNGHFGDTIMRQYLYDTYHELLLEQLKSCNIPSLAAIAEKALKEVQYHIKWSRDWVVTLGDGTQESHQRMKDAFNALWPYALEAFEPSGYQVGLRDLNLIVINWTELKKRYLKRLEETFEEASLFDALERVKQASTQSDIHQKGGKQGRHTENLGFILTELQYMQRSYPGLEW